ncbi:hypothetical protein [Hymenobacter cheonanensis]|uniref:hypothetical protein n=1 Tax=Hymenobacter sp. CA2-7 TaxID=3063993 RepID=UPI002713D4EB|nr:hypothetical protein [Hymenobacter sp. CA2-7]MDO7887065.1 hypothetical protein [Hymenobacter sp. CA2-7]
MPEILTLTETDTFHLRHDAAAQLLRGHWPAPVLDADLRSHYAELLAQAQEHAGCRYWLLDMRRRAWHMPSFDTWFSAGFAAEVQAALGQPVFIAYVLSPRHQTAAESTRTQVAQRACAQHDVYPCFFAEEDAALAWLHHQQGLR